jgi:hypothetical protein
MFIIGSGYVPVEINHVPEETDANPPDPDPLVAEVILPNN